MFSAAHYMLRFQQVVEYDSSSSLYEQLLQMRKTGVYVSVHTSNLANAPLLQPGSAVFELIHVSMLGTILLKGSTKRLSLKSSILRRGAQITAIHSFAWIAYERPLSIYSVVVSAYLAESLGLCTLLSRCCACKYAGIHLHTHACSAQFLIASPDACLSNTCGLGTFACGIAPYAIYILHV